MDGPGKTLRRRKLARSLTRHREAAGLNQREMAKAARLSYSTISRIESGEHTIVPRNVQLILQACGVGSPEMDFLLRVAEDSEDVAWWLTYSDLMPDWFAEFVDLESDAERIRTYTSEVVHGLLQTRDYALAVAKASGLDRPEIRTNRTVDLREARQDRLDRLALHVVMNEAVIRRTFGSDEIMRGQTERLIELGDRDNITIQVLPFSAGGHPGIRGPFTLMQFPDGYDEVDCVYLETENGGVWQERASDIERYNAVFASVCELALTPEDSRALLASLE